MRIKLTAAILIAAVALAGCGSSTSGDDTRALPGSGVPLNKTGKPPTQADSQVAAERQKEGGTINSDMQKDAAAMQAAKARAGGK